MASSPGTIPYLLVGERIVSQRITSTLSGQKEDFEVSGRPVRMYVCGMTPKYHPHVGHARVFVSADILRRYLEYKGYEIVHVQNFTDVDDKIIARAKVDGITPAEAAKRYSDSYFEVMDRLNVLRAHQYPTVTGSMDAIVDYVKGLIERGYAYESEGDVYFQVDRFEAYGQLARRTEEGQLQGVRVDLEPGKRDPRDFALWKRAKPEEPHWPSPWGDGRPGWHIECSAMVRETLGDQIDIHGGGRDLIFPHHENELAQSEAYTGVHPFVRYWAHAGLVTTGSEKMAHSLENFTTIAQVLDVYEPMVVRLFLLQTHYRSSILYTRDALDNAGRALARLRGALDGYSGAATEPAARPSFAADARAAFERAMDDDFNTPGALAALFDLVREINRRRDAGAPAGEVEAGQHALQALAGVLGLQLDAPDSAADGADAGPFIELLVQTRQRLREAKQWALADEVRDRLRDLGVLVEDRPGGAVWRRERAASAG
ncbi:MAG: cysteine--tRNA ligase [Chloroflexi bacterium]|nr:cysteine--tRNA ligase [Chloroflexota bacterium]